MKKVNISSFFTLLLCVLLLVACVKKEPTAVSGTVRNAVNDSVLAGVPVNLWVNYNVSKKKAEIVASAVTDSNGQYSFQFEAKVRKDYTIVIDYDKFATLYEDPYYPKIKTTQQVVNGIFNTIDLYPATYGLVKLKIEKTSFNDSIRVRTYHQTFKPQGFETTYWTYRNGEVFEDVNYQQIFVGTYVIDYITYFNGNGTQHLDYVEVTQGQSYNPVISY